jgi:hypothetical protein
MKDLWRWWSWNLHYNGTPAEWQGRGWSHDQKRNRVVLVSSVQDQHCTLDWIRGEWAWQLNEPRRPVILPYFAQRVGTIPGYVADILSHARGNAECARMCADVNYPEGGQDAWDKIVEILG